MPEKKNAQAESCTQALATLVFFLFWYIILTPK